MRGMCSCDTLDCITAWAGAGAATWGNRKNSGDAGDASHSESAKVTVQDPESPRPPPPALQIGQGSVQYRPASQCYSSRRIVRTASRSCSSSL